MDLSADQIQKLKDTIGNKLWRLNNLYFIRNKEGEVVRFKLNPEQEYYISNRHHRNANLKARQLGFTTLAVIDALDDCLFNNHFEAGIIAHSLDDAQKIFGKAKLAFERLPEWLKKLRKPNTDKAGEYVFPNGSKFSVDTSFRGGTLSRLHVSELAKISKKYPEKAKEIITGAFEAVPKNGYIDIESTAEGVSGEFYDICQTAMGKQGRDLTSLEFKFFFFPWYKTPEYKIEADIEFSPGLKEYFSYLEKEQSIFLSKEQKNWYALKKESLGDEMAQEYPSYPEEAFLASGRPVFNQQKISGDIKSVKNIHFETEGFLVGEKNQILRVFNRPDKEEAYAIGADVAEGLEIGDSSTITVLNKSFDQVAVYKGKIDPDEFGRFLVQVSKFYNNAILAPEVNNAGIAVIESIKREKYFNMYRREVREELGKDIQDKIGWHTNIKTKKLMLDELKAAYRDGSLNIKDEATLREMLTISYEEDGNIIMNGKDLTVSLAIAIQAIKQAIVPGEYKAFIPVSNKKGDTAKMTIEEKLRYYKRMRR